MKVYDCKVNLGGPVLHLAPKENVSAAEIVMLLMLHGDDSVRDIVEKADVKVSHSALYDYLAARYTPDAVKAQFGPNTNKLILPEELDMAALFPQVDADGVEEAEMLMDPTAAALEAIKINETNAQRGTLSLPNKPAAPSPA